MPSISLHRYVLFDVLLFRLLFWSWSRKDWTQKFLNVVESVKWVGHKRNIGWRERHC